jgi:archaeosine synthase
MNFIVKKTDGPARLGTFEINGKNIATPNILFINTNRFKHPDLAEVVLTNDNKILKKPVLRFSKNIDFDKSLFNKEYDFFSTVKEKNLFIMEYTNQLTQQPKKFLEALIKKRENNSKEIFYTPAIGNPSNLALLTYLGIDLFDSISAIIAARNKVLFFSDGEKNLDHLEEIPCNCPICNSTGKNPLKMGFEEILVHNYHILFDELKKVRNAIRKRELRSLVEKKAVNDPNLSAILRNLDHNYYDFLEKTTTIHSDSIIYATLKESMNRPEIKRFQERVINRYHKPKSVRILLLLPCSAKKPYSFSKSHKLFREAINQVENSNVVHELIITSPLGLVPKELELVYPAAYYDIPVTGIWDEDEKKMIRTYLKKYLDKNKYEEIVVHLPKEIISFIKDVLEKPIITCVDSPTSKKSLLKLKEELNNVTSKFEKVKTIDRLKENVGCLASYQFGKDISEKLVDNAAIKGKYPWYKIIDGKQQLGMVTDNRGLISLTNYGGKKIQSVKSYWVEIFDDFELKGSVFAPGVKNADEQIRINDDVIVLRNKKLAGVGVALMNGYDMKQSSYGEAVKMRHRV